MWNSNRGWHGGGQPRHGSQNSQRVYENQNVAYPPYGHMGGSYGGWNGMNPSYSHMGGAPFGGWNGMYPTYNHIGRSAYGAWNESMYPTYSPMGAYPYGGWNEYNPSTYNQRSGLSNRGHNEIHPVDSRRGRPYRGHNEIHPTYNHRGASFNRGQNEAHLTYNHRGASSNREQNEVHLTCITREASSNREQNEVHPTNNRRGASSSREQNEVRPTDSHRGGSSQREQNEAYLANNHRGGSSHKGRGHGNTTRGCSNTSRGGSNTTRGGGNATRGGRNTTRGGGNATRGGGNTTRGGVNTTRGGVNTTREGSNMTRGGNNTTRGGDNTTRGGRNITKGGANTTGGLSNTTRKGNNTVKENGKTTRGSHPTTKGHAQCPRGDRDYNHGQERSKDKDCLDGNRPTTEPQQQYLEFPFIQDCETVRLLPQFHVMFILRGAPGSGKSTVASVMRQQAKDKDIVCSADDYRYNENGVYVWVKEKLEETHSKCKEKAEKLAANGEPSIIIDNTNVRTVEVEPYMKIARQYDYVVVLVEPKTPWKRQAGLLVKKTPHNVPLITIRRRLEDFDEILPLYFAWFLSPEDSVKLPTLAKDILFKCLQIDEFKDFIKAFAGRSSREFTVDDVESYYSMEQQQEPYHVTACFSPRGKSLAGSPYHKARAVVSALGRISFLSIVGFVVTESTFSARVSLTNTQRELLVNLDQRQPGRGHGYGRVVSQRTVREMTRSLKKLPLEDSARPAVERPDNCSDASTHITLGTKQDVNPVQAKHDVQTVINVETASQGFDEHALADGIGNVRKYSDELWVVYLNEANIIKIPAIFSGRYPKRMVNDFMEDFDDFDI